MECPHCGEAFDPFKTIQGRPSFPSQNSRLTGGDDNLNEDPFGPRPDQGLRRPGNDRFADPLPPLGQIGPIPTGSPDSEGDPEQSAGPVRRPANHAARNAEDDSSRPQDPYFYPPTARQHHDDPSDADAERRRVRSALTTHGPQSDVDPNPPNRPMTHRDQHGTDFQEGEKHSEGHGRPGTSSPHSTRPKDSWGVPFGDEEQDVEPSLDNKARRRSTSRRRSTGPGRTWDYPNGAEQPQTTPEQDQHNQNPFLQTMGLGDFDRHAFGSTSPEFAIQFLDREDNWVEWKRFNQKGLKIGRGRRAENQKHGLNSLAKRHLRLGFEGEQLVAEDLGSINGVYRRITKPEQLREGDRFRVGNHVLQFEGSEEEPPTVTLISEEGEEFWSADISVRAFIRLVRPDGSLGIQFPITKTTEPTLIGRSGRAGKAVDLALLSDRRASSVHASIRMINNQFVLEDLGSRNGTFVKLQGVTPIDIYDVLLVGHLQIRVVSVT